MSAIQGDWYASRSTHNGEAYPQDDDTVRFVYATQADGTKFIVAKVWSGDDGDYAGTAKLVAAAPDMLEALDSIRSSLMELDDDGLGRPGCGWREMDATYVDELISNSLRRAIDAIAKAEGRE
jgi:hypothetical protein